MEILPDSGVSGSSPQAPLASVSRSSASEEAEDMPTSSEDVTNGDGTAEPVIKRARRADEEEQIEEASSSTSPSTASLTTITLVVPVVETAEATPTKEPSPIPMRACGNTNGGATTPLATSSALRKFHKIPIFIVDYHNDVLEFIYRCLATRHLPLENNILVHFDSHPDMVINRSIAASAAFDKEAMLECLGIESWIMPTCFTGNFNRVAWLKNSWCTQIPVGSYSLKVGQNNDVICVDSTLDYFMSEGSYCAANEMEDTRDLQLHVIDADSNDLEPARFISAADVHSFVLDIDLDFFSTANPFLDIYSLANCYERLTEIFHFETSPTDCNGSVERRKQQLRALRTIFEHLEVTQSLENLPASVFETLPEHIMMKIRDLYEALNKNYTEEELDWMIIYDSGCTTDSNGLPHHVSTDDELDQYFANFKRFLQRLPIPPVAVTMACSAEDDYCPKFQVRQIQQRVLCVLRDVFGELMHAQPILQYMDEEWDIMQL